MKIHRWLFNFHVSFFTIVLTGMLILIYKPSAANSGIFYVAPEGDCGGQTPCFANPQQAVDAALSGDEIRVAAGIYTGVNNIGGKSQHLYINKDLLLRGGIPLAIGMCQTQKSMSLNYKLKYRVELFSSLETQPL